MNDAPNTGITTWGQDQWATLGYPLPPGVGLKERERWGGMGVDQQRRAWWLLKSGGSMSDMSTEAELQDFIVAYLAEHTAP